MTTSFFSASGTCCQQHPQVEAQHPSGMRTRRVPLLQLATLWVRTYPNHSLPKRGSGIWRGRRRTKRSVRFGGSCGTSSDLWSWRPRPGARAPLGRGLSVRPSVQHCPHRGPQKMQVSNLLRHSSHKNPSFPFSWSKAWLSSLFLSSRRVDGIHQHQNSFRSQVVPIHEKPWAANFSCFVFFVPVVSLWGTRLSCSATQWWNNCWAAWKMMVGHFC